MTRSVNISTAAPVAAAGGDSEVLATISSHIRAMRSERRLSLDQLSARSGVSKGMLVQIERGATNPSIGTLCKVSAALGASIADLVDVAGASRADVVPAAAPRTLWTGARGGHGTLLVGSTGPDVLELWMWELRPGDRYEAPAHTGGTQELLHVTQGRLELEVGGVSYVVGTGQAVRAFTDRPHAYACAGARPVRFTMAVAEWRTRDEGTPAPRRRSARS
jgi:transcriptional regulator with XRE-family HTH domain